MNADVNMKKDNVAWKVNLVAIIAIVVVRLMVIVWSRILWLS